MSRSGALSRYACKGGISCVEYTALTPDHPDYFKPPLLVCYPYLLLASLALPRVCVPWLTHGTGNEQKSNTPAPDPVRVDKLEKRNLSRTGQGPSSTISSSSQPCHPPAATEPAFRRSLLRQTVRSPETGDVGPQRRRLRCLGYQASSARGVDAVAQQTAGSASRQDGPSVSRRGHCRASSPDRLEIGHEMGCVASGDPGGDAVERETRPESGPDRTVV